MAPATVITVALWPGQVTTSKPGDMGDAGKPQDLGETEVCRVGRA